MSGGISISSVDIATFLFGFDCVRSVSFTSFLVRNWCGYPNLYVHEEYSHFCELFVLRSGAESGETFGLRGGSRGLLAGLLKSWDPIAESGH
jgi:hypothetical protein